VAHSHATQPAGVRAVASDEEGRIFTGGFAEFGYWQTDEMGNYQYQSLSQYVVFPKVQREEIWHILVHNEHIYFQSFSTIYDYDYKEIKVLSPPSNIMFLQAIGNRLLLQGLQKGLYELDSNKNFKLLDGSGFLANAVISTILPYKKGFLIGTTKDGIFKFENNHFSVWNEVSQSISKDFQLNKGILLSNGNYAFGTILNGIFVLNTEGGLIYHINKENGLQNNTVLSMYEDHAKNLWLGLDKGIDLIDLTTPLTFFQDKSGKIGTVYAATLFNDKLYVGTNQGVFYKNRVGGGSFQLLKGLQGQAWDLKIFDNQLLCGHNSGTFIINKDNSILKISDETGGWCAIRHPSVPDVLIQGLYTGLALFKKNKDGNWAFYKKIIGFGEPTKKIAFDENGYLWAITAYHQLFKIKLSENGLNTEGVEQKEVPAHSKPYFDFIGHHLVFSGDKGFYAYDKNTNQFAEINQKIFSNNKGKLVQGLGKDLIKIEEEEVVIIIPNGTPFPAPENRSEKTTIHFKLKLMSDYETVIALDSSHYLFGLDDGYAIFDKNKVPYKTAYSPKLIIRLYAKDGKSFHFYATQKLTTPIKLPPQYRELKMSFAIPYFTNSPQFQYFLSNHLQEWSDWSTTTDRDFVNLSSGVHQFQLKNNIVTDEVAIAFEIKPYWYETIYAQLFYLCLVLTGFYWLQKYHTYQLEKQRKKLEAEKERELEQQRIVIDNEKLHTEVIAKSRELANSTMNIIQKNEVLLEIQTELDTMKTGLPEKHYNRLSHLIDYNLTHEESARIFEDNFNEVHEDFLKRLKSQYPDLTPGDLKLAAFLRMNLSSKEISPLLFISVRSIENKRSRLRKKIGLSDSDNLTSFLMQY
jgi:DNA-binding CsgD family transcriptional regulator